MPIVLNEYNLAYFPVPKTGCTSLKEFFFEVENDRRFTPFIRNGQHFHIHHVYPSNLFSDLRQRQVESLDCFLVVRDPVARFLSAYSNRVLHHRELSEEFAGNALKKRDLPSNPSLSEFVGRIDSYRGAVPTIDHHVRPLVDFAGTDAGFYTRIFSLSDVEEFADHVRKKVGKPVGLQRLQTGGPKITPDALTGKELRMLRELYAEDFIAYGNFF